MGLLKKITKPISKILDKIIPNEIKPALPFLSAFAPMMMGPTGIMGSSMLVDVFHQKRWDYIYSEQPGGEPRKQKKLKVDKAKAQTRVTKIFPKLKKAYPDARTSLDHKNPLQLLIATILAAQCTDIRVNIVTKDLFKK